MATLDDVNEVLSYRSNMYRSLANLYFDVLSQEQIEELANRDYTDLMQDENELMASGFNDVYRALRKRHTGTQQQLAMDFTSCFLGAHTYEGLTAAPYESLYVDPSGVLMGRARHEIFSLYKRERVALQKDLDFADDHLSFECEFMAILCERTRSALDARNFSEAERLLDVQQDFLKEHLCFWFPRFHNLTTKFIETRFYRGVLKITRGFLNDEEVLVADLIEVVKEKEAANGSGKAMQGAA